MNATQEDHLDLEALYVAQWRSMVRFAVLLVDDPGLAEDVVQDVFLRLHRKQDSLRSQAAAVSYVRTSVLNGCRSVLRRRRVARRHARVEEKRVADLVQDDPAAIRAEFSHVLDAVRKLPRRQREVVVLRYWSLLSEREVAETLGVSVGTVKSTTSRALDGLEALLGENR